MDNADKLYFLYFGIEYKKCSTNPNNSKWIISYIILYIEKKNEKKNCHYFIYYYYYYYLLLLLLLIFLKYK